MSRIPSGRKLALALVFTTLVAYSSASSQQVAVDPSSWGSCPANLATCTLNQVGVIQVQHGSTPQHRCSSKNGVCSCECQGLAAPPCSDSKLVDSQGFTILKIKNSEFTQGISDRPRAVDTRIITVGGIAYSPFQFSKTLHHDNVTFMPTEADAVLLRAATAFNAPDGAIQAVKQSMRTTRKIEGLYSGHQKRLRSGGAALGTLFVPNYHPVDSIEGLCDVIENYWANILAVKPFNKYSESQAVNDAVTELKKCVSMGAFKGPKPTSASLFRGNFPGELDGPYVSQFLVSPYKLGDIPSENRVIDLRLQTTQRLPDGWRRIQNGEVPQAAVNSGTKFVYSAATLGSMVHSDALFQLYYTGALVGLQSGIKLTNQLPENTCSSAWKEFGGPDLLGHIATVADGALRHSWITKFHDYMKIRPEVMAMRMAQLTDSAYDATVKTQLESIVKPEFIAKMAEFSKTRSYLNSVDLNKDPDGQALSESSVFSLLVSLYPEMSPTHPAFPAGHSVVAGACTTIMKAFFVTHDDNKNALPWPTTGKTTTDGLNLEDLSIEDQAAITINGELNKLAQNVEMGRMFAQVHYRSDSNGILLGEEFALSYLVDNLADYGSQFQHDKSPDIPEADLTPVLTLQKFDGSFVKVTSFGVNQLL